MDSKGVTRALRRAGLMAEPAAVRVLTQHIDHIQTVTQHIKTFLAQNYPGKTPLLTADIIQQCLQGQQTEDRNMDFENTQPEEEEHNDEREEELTTKSHENCLVIQATHAQKIQFFNSDGNRGRTEKTCSGGFLADNCNEKSLMMLNRYHLVHQRLLRNPLFQSSIVDLQFNPGAKKFEIVPVTSLISVQQGEIVCLFGLLDEVGDNSYTLEDSSGTVELDFSNCEETHGVIFPGCFVLVEGRRRSTFLEVITLGLPPAESRQETLTVYPNLRSGTKLRPTKGSVLFVSDVSLTDSSCTEDLRSVIDNLRDNQLSTVILIGDLVYPKRTMPLWRTLLQEALTNFFESIGQTKIKFILIPGPNDDILLPKVKPAVPWKLLDGNDQDFTMHDVELVTNPCKLIFENQEIVIFREQLTDLVLKTNLKFSREHSSSQEDEIPREENLVRTLCDQAHMFPFLPNQRPVAWNYDCSLYLHPLPNLLVLAEDCEPFKCEYMGMNAVNPGSFRKERSFYVYNLESGESEFSRIL